MTTQHIKNDRYLGPLSECLKRLENGGLSDGELAEALQALLEKKPYSQSSLTDKDVICYGDVAMTKDFLAQTMVYNGQLMKRHCNGGGWVPAEQDEEYLGKPYVASSAYVGPFAMVCNNARVYGDAYVSGYARVYSKAHVSGRARVYGDAQVFDHARVYGDAQVFDRARVYGDAQVFDHARVHGDAQVFGHARVHCVKPGSVSSAKWSG